MKLTPIQKYKVKQFAKRLVEARDNTYAEYEVKKDKVIAYVSAQKGSAFTKIAKQWKEFEKATDELAERKRKLNEELQASKEMEDSLKDQIREKVTSIFDEEEQAMSLAVHCLNSTFTVSKLAAENQPTTTTKKGDIVSTDYKKVLELLMEQNEDLKGAIDNLIRQCSIIAVEDIIAPGKKRRASISVEESFLRENIIWDKIVNIYNKISTRISKVFGRLRSRKQLIDQQLLLIGENKMKLTPKQKQLVKEYIKSLQSKKLNEDLPRRIQGRKTWEILNWIGAINTNSKIEQNVGFELKFIGQPKKVKDSNYLHSYEQDCIIEGESHTLKFSIELVK